MYPWLDRAGQFSWLKMSVFLGILLPGIWIALAWAFGQSANVPAQGVFGTAAGSTAALPVTGALQQIGLWAVRFLLITLAVTPLRRIGGWPRLITLRRMVGVAAFAYAATHFSLYIVQQNYRLLFVATEIVQRIYLTIGFVTLLSLLVLALTSTDSAMRRLGGRKWQRLHYLIYPLAMLGLAHFFMQSKISVSEPALMSGLFAWLMLYRIAYRWNGARALSLWHLAGLALSAAVITLLGEAAWYQFATGIGGERILRATFDLRHIRPAGWVLLAGTAIIPLQIAAERLWNQRDRAGRSRAGRAGRSALRT